MCRLVKERLCLEKGSPARYEFLRLQTPECIKEAILCSRSEARLAYHVCWTLRCTYCSVRDVLLVRALGYSKVSIPGCVELAICLAMIRTDALWLADSDVLSEVQGICVTQKLANVVFTRVDSVSMLYSEYALN
ncbi:hypothetical protein Tco_0087096 [Tanacetum coccineum]